MPSQPSRKPSLEELAEFRKKETSKAFPGWTLEEVQTLEAYLRGKDSQLLRRYLSLNKDHLERVVWEAQSWEAYLVLRGEKRMLKRLEMLPEEIARWKEQLSTEKELKEGEI